MKTPRFSTATIKFLLKAARQKKPDWLDRNREEYETAILEPLKNLAQHLKSSLGPAAAGYHFPLKGIGRLKRPAHRASEYGGLYKSWLGYTASRPSGSRFDHNPSLFFMINPHDEDDPVLIAGGLYMPSSRQLRAVREAIANDATPFDRLFASPAFARRFRGGFSDERKATRPPRGFDPEHPRLDWLKLQGFYVWRPYKAREFHSPNFPALVQKDCEQILRLNALLELAIQGRLPRGSGEKREVTPKALLRQIETVEAPRRKMDF